MLEVIAAARNAAQLDAAVLLTGETGVGKEVVARIIHQHSPRRARPWIDLNCAALPEHLVESELFGYEKGAFSGADTAKPGLFEAANRGTLFLDEIGDLDLKVQGKLLRALDGMPYFRLGGSRKVSSDIRVLAATNRELESAVREGSFRRDLYHRISEVHLHIPPLRQRPQDIAALARHFLAKCLPGSRFTEDALQLLMQYAWRGNVRELRNFVLKLAMTNPASEIGGEDIRRHLTEETPFLSTAPSPPPPELVSVAEMERQMILRALELTAGNQTRAAEHLGMPRRTFCRKLQQFEIVCDRRRGAPRKPYSEPTPDRRKAISVLVSLLTETGQRIAASACNLSLGGLGLRNLQAHLEPGEKLTVALTAPGSGQTLELRAVVAWSHSNGTAGLRFADLSAAQQDALHRWIAAPLHSSLPALRTSSKNASSPVPPLL